jgi:hypothetical protein
MSIFCTACKGLGQKSHKKAVFWAYFKKKATFVLARFLQVQMT